MADSPNTKNNDYQARKEADDKRRYINQTTESVLSNRGDYNISQLTFPENTMSNDVPHYVSFFINIRGKSKFNTDNRFKDRAVERANDAQLNPNQIDKANQVLAAGGGAVAGGVAGAGRGGTGRAARAAGGAVAGAAAGSLAYNGLTRGVETFKPDKSYRIKDVITLAAQEPPSVNYSAEWQGQSLGAIFGALAKGIDGITNLKGAAAMEGAAVAGAAVAAGAMGSLIGKGVSGKGQFGGIVGGAIGAERIVGPQMQAMTKTKANPFREMLFEQINFRKFRFAYKFLPRNRGEVDSIMNIINTFKFHMHPELSSGNLFFIYPAEFQIVYYFQNKENPFVQKIAPSALTDLSVTYGGTGGMSSFHDGAPTEINMSLEFQELELLTKEKIELGY
jgi:hypothetical protein